MAIDPARSKSSRNFWKFFIWCTPFCALGAPPVATNFIPLDSCFSSLLKSVFARFPTNITVQEVNRQEKYALMVLAPPPLEIDELNF